MDRKPNHTCRVCGTAYYACAKCDKQKNWRAFCDTPECFQIFQVLLMYSRNIIDADEATANLISLGITPDNHDGLLPQKVAEVASVFEAANQSEVKSEPDEENCETDVLKTRKKSRRSDA